MILIKCLMVFFLGFIISCGPGTNDYVELSVSDIWDKVSPSVFMLKSSAGHCSSFHIGNGYFLSANHCYDPVLSLIDNNKNKYDVEVIGRDELSDLLLFKTNIPFLINKAIISSEEAEVGERVVSIGFPGYMTEKSFMVGYVLGYKNNFLLTDGNSYSGMSGGLLADEEGKVVGVTSAIKLGGRAPDKNSSEENAWQHRHADISFFSRIYTINNLLKTKNVVLE